MKPEIVKQYVDTGKATMVFKHSAFLGEESIWAAIAAECAADQEKFWVMHDKLFASQEGENQGAFTKDKLLALAQEAGLDMAQFEPCLNEEKTRERVEGDTREGQAFGVRGTPTFFINGQPLVGAQPLENFVQAIDAAIAAAQ